MDEVQKSLVKANHDLNLKALEGYHEKAVSVGRTMYDGAAKASLHLDNLLHFTSGNVAHVDGSLGDLARSKMLSIFKSAQARGLLSIRLPRLKQHLFQVLLPRRTWMTTTSPGLERGCWGVMTRCELALPRSARLTS